MQTSDKAKSSTALAATLGVSRQRADQIMHPEKHSARKAVAVALRRGALERPSECSKCGLHCLPDAHHGDYERPLDVQWLCRACHTPLHQHRGRGRTGPRIGKYPRSVHYHAIGGKRTRFEIDPPGFRCAYRECAG